MALSITNLTSGRDTTNNPASTASVNPASGSRTYLWIGYAVEGGQPTHSGDTFSISGSRGTWTQLAHEYSSGADSRRAVALYVGTGSVANEAISITVTPQVGTWTETAWVVDEVTGFDTGDPDDAPVTTEGTGSTLQLPDVGTPGTGDRVYIGCTHEVDEAISVSGFTQTAQVTGGSDVRRFAVFYDASDPQDETPTFSTSTAGQKHAIGLILNVGAAGSSSVSPSVSPSASVSPSPSPSAAALTIIGRTVLDYD